MSHRFYVATAGGPSKKQQSAGTIPYACACWVTITLDHEPIYLVGSLLVWHEKVLGLCPVYVGAAWHLFRKSYSVHVSRHMPSLGCVVAV